MSQDSSNRHTIGRRSEWCLQGPPVPDQVAVPDPRLSPKDY